MSWGSGIRSWESASFTAMHVCRLHHPLSSPPTYVILERSEGSRSSRTQPTIVILSRRRKITHPRAVSVTRVRLCIGA